MNKLLVFFVLTFFCFSSYGWGVTGHRATGWIAEKHLNKKARKALQHLLKGQSLAMVSTWMDEVRADSTYNYMNDWHWVTIPYGQTYEQTEKNINSDIIATIERIIAELKTKKLSEEEQAQRIKILVHLIGDIHQPLHVGGRDDKGGNNVKVMWFKGESNLHSVWDSNMIDDTRLSYTEFAQSLNIPSESEVQSWQKASVRDWAKESQLYEKEVYDIGAGKLGYRYAYLNYHIVRNRVLQAGIRMAGIFNDIYGK